MLPRFSANATLLAFLIHATATANASALEPLPHIPMISHETMTYNGKVIYEADVDMASPSYKPVALRIGLDDFSWDCMTGVGHVSAASSSAKSGSRVTSGYMIGCVVRNLKEDGTAAVDVIYSASEPGKADKSEHIAAIVKAGVQYRTTTESGMPVTLLLRLAR